MNNSILDELEKVVQSNPESKHYYDIEEQLVNISKILGHIRKNQQITQIQIASETGLSKQMISKIEKYNGNPTLRTLIKYCDCLGINLYDLLRSAYYEKK